jgi:hypothetical protein
LIDTVVEKVWRLRANLVENLRTQKFFVGVTFRQFGGLPLWMAPSRGASLDPLNALRKINRRPPRAISSDAPSADPLRVGRTDPFKRRQSTVTVHRFEETIGGRAYLIEVMLVSDRWRAQLLRAPGVPTAMMPFYGPTPDEAARQLTDWLSLAYRRSVAATVAPRVST